MTLDSDSRICDSQFAYDLRRASAAVTFRGPFSFAVQSPVSVDTRTLNKLLALPILLSEARHLFDHEFRELRRGLSVDRDRDFSGALDDLAQFVTRLRP